MNKDKDFLGTEPVGKLMFRLALPTITAQLINMLYNIIDRIYIGHIPGNGHLPLPESRMYATDYDHFRFCRTGWRRWCTACFD
mgnify:CR=1 FL=1